MALHSTQIIASKDKLNRSGPIYSPSHKQEIPSIHMGVATRTLPLDDWPAAALGDADLGGVIVGDGETGEGQGISGEQVVRVVLMVCDDFIAEDEAGEAVIISASSRGVDRNVVREAIVMNRRQSHGYRERTTGPTLGWA